jgi:hypothetical protein
LRKAGRAVSTAKEWAMLVLSRKKDESIVINNDITIVVVEIRGDKVRLGVERPAIPAEAGPLFQPTLAEARAIEAARGSKTPSQARGEWSVAKAGTLLARTAVVDMAAFFAILLVGFAYVWCRGDLDWVRAVSTERAAA